MENFSAIVDPATNISESLRKRGNSWVKIYDPSNLGASCGSSGRKIHPRWLLSKIPPRWLLSKIPPEPIEDDALVPNIRKRWWQRIFETT